MELVPGRMQQDDENEAIPVDEAKKIEVCGATLTVVSSMTVLGSVLSAHASSGDDVDFRVSRATAAFYANQRQLMCRHVNIKIRVVLLFKLVGQ
eukprot:328979-Karenia_brevis.AAC.1